MKVPTEQQIRSWTPDERARVRARAASMTSEEGKVTVDLIDSLHLPLSSGGMSTDHPLYIEMMEVAWSADGKKAAVDAVEKGLPAMAGLDPLLQKAMGSRYSADQQGAAAPDATHTATRMPAAIIAATLFLIMLQRGGKYARKSDSKR